MLLPPKLKRGDHLRIVSPATSLALIPEDQRQSATLKLEELGLTVSFGQHACDLDLFDSSPVQARVDDLHQAFADPGVNGILTTLGGYNSNQLLAALDYEHIRAHPKMFCGYSDITALQAAIYARTGLVTYSGPHFTTFAMRHGLEYTVVQFSRCVMSSDAYQVHPAPHWSDDPWYRDQETRTFHSHSGYLVIQPGQAEGTLLGGNLCTLNLLQGTPYMPPLSGTILLVEDDAESSVATFDRDLQSLCHQPGFDRVQALVVGRFQPASKMSDKLLTQLVRNKPELTHMPVVANASFGHTTPQFTFPQGGCGRLIAGEDSAVLEIVMH